MLVLSIIHITNKIVSSIISIICTIVPSIINISSTTVLSMICIRSRQASLISALLSILTQPDSAARCKLDLDFLLMGH